MRLSATAIFAVASALLLPGCIARTLVDVATAPVRVAGKAVDLATTSQSEADEKRGRAMRKDEERLGRLERRYHQHTRQCDGGDAGACDRADTDRAEIDRAEIDRSAPGGGDRAD